MDEALYTLREVCLLEWEGLEVSQINICIYCTETNNRLVLAKESIASLMDTVDLSKHSVVLIDNNSTKEAKEWLAGLNCVTVITMSENVGTARGINMGLKMRKAGDVQIKADEDVVWHSSGWVEELEQVFLDYEDIGICGLKRKDVWQSVDHPEMIYRTYMDGRLEICDDIIGTCTAFNPKLVEKIGLMVQNSSFYGFDDQNYAVRSIAAGFRNAFLPSVSIDHIDPGASAYTEWKKREAAAYIGEASIYMDMIKQGKISYYNDGE